VPRAARRAVRPVAAARADGADGFSPQPHRFGVDATSNRNTPARGPSGPAPACGGNAVMVNARSIRPVGFA
jgi:hypothetical protein